MVFKKKYNFKVILSLLLLSVNCEAQNFDSLFVELNSLKTDKEKIDVFYKTLLQSEKTKQEFDPQLRKFDFIATKFIDEKDQAYALLKKGDFLHSKRDDKSAFKFYYGSLSLYEKLGDKENESRVHYKIGVAMNNVKNYTKAPFHFYTSLKFATEIKDTDLIADNHAAIGLCYKDEKKIDSSVFHHMIALKCRTDMKKDKAIASSYNDLGVAYKMAENYELALDYLVKALVLREKIKDKKGVAGACINIGNTLKRLKRYREAQKYFIRGIDMSRELKHITYLYNGLGGRAENSFYLGDYKQSAADYMVYNEGQDSLYAENLKAQLSELEISYQSEKKDAEIVLQQEQIKTKTVQNSKQKILIVASCIALAMALIAIFVVYRSYRQNKKNAAILAAKNHLIEEKNKEITDSINYAQLIQQSLLASKEMLDKNLESYFIIYKPKDIVSGDFYWASETPKGFLVACVDCTGHGVPGAFMSLIGKENLDKALAKTVSPGEILQELNISVKRSLNQNNAGGNKDGMDAAVLRIEKDKNGNAKVTYAGANRPLYILKKDLSGVEEITATKQAIGGFTKNEQIFTEHSIQVEKGDTLVITTDGYADQFGSETNKKLTTKRFKELLVSVKAKSADEQMQTLNDFFTIWKGHREQIDDLLVIGINV